MIESKHYINGFFLDSKTIKKYDDNGNRIEYKQYSSDGSLGIEIIRKYDDNGNIIESKDSSLNSIFIHKYKYDNYGNWNKVITYENSFPVEISEREIEYYK